MKFFNYKTKSVFLLLLFVSLSRAELYIDILGGDEKLVPIVILPFETNVVVSLKYDMEKIVKDDLKRSGLFSVVKLEEEKYSRSLDNVNYKFYRKFGAENVLTAKVREIHDNQYVVQISLYDVLLKEKKFTYQWTFTRNQLRHSAHQISDLVFREITGREGAFSANLAFVVVQKIARNKRVYRLKISDTDGLASKTVLKSSMPILSPAWSMDGKKLAYVSFEGGKSEIFMHDLYDGKREKIASFNGINSAPAWSPDGRSLAMTLSLVGNSEVYIMDLETRKLKRITRNLSIDTEAIFSPDGSSLYFTSDRSGRPQIYQIDLTTGQITQITTQGNYNAGAVITQDGNYLALVHAEEGGLKISLYDIRKQEFYPITTTFLDDSPSISPGADMLVYSAVSVGSGNGQLIIMNLRATSRLVLQAPNGAIKDPVWGPARKIVFDQPLAE